MKEGAMPLAGDGRQLLHAIRAGRGDNHARGRDATWGAIVALLLALCLAAAPAGAQDSPLVQRDVPAEATAENAVVARERALAAGQRLAYERMAAQLGLPRGLSDAQIEAQVASLVIESERVTPRGYAARITVNFRQPGSARAPAGPGEGPQVAGAVPGAATAATVDAIARYRSFPEYAELQRRLKASPAVSRVEVVTVAGDMARLRVSLRSQPMDAVSTLADGGVALMPPGTETPQREGWRLGLGGR